MYPESITLLTLGVLLFFQPYQPNLLMVQGQLLPIVGTNSDGIRTYIVHVQKPEGTKFLRSIDRRNWYMSFLPNISLDSGEPRMVYMYHHVISGFAARLTHEEVKAMESMDGFVLAYPSIMHEAQTTYTPQFLGLNAADGLWSKTFQGSGKIIGVLDSGIKPTHPSFRDHGMAPPPTKWAGHCYWGKPICNDKLIGAVAFRNGHVGGSPEDDDGHGTHVASTAAGNFVDDAEVLGNGKGQASGMAPKAHLAIYKVLWPGRGGRSFGSDADILAAIEQAIRDNVDVLSMSLGSTLVPLHRSGVDVGSFSAIRKGIFPCAAAANEGPISSLIANDAPWVLTVGASSIDRRIRVTVRLGDGRELFGESAYQPASIIPKELPLVFPGAIANDPLVATCNVSLANFNVAGKIVVCMVGENSDVDKGEGVKAAGGAGVIVLNNWERGNTTLVYPHVLQAANLDYWAAEEIKKYYNNNQNPTATILFNGTQFGFRPTPGLAFFSSRGPSFVNGGIAKPDVIAPGVNILAAWPFEVGPNPTGTATKTFNFLSGTSMAAPHVSGIAAMLQSNHPTWSPAAIKSAIMTTADALDLDGNRIKDHYSNSTADPQKVGSGHVNPQAANEPGLIYDLEYYDYIHYLCGTGFKDFQVSAIAQTTVNCSQVKGISMEQLNYPSFSVVLGPSSPNKTVTRTVTNVGDANSIYTARYIEPEAVNMDVNPTTLQFSQVGEKITYNITFTINRTPPPRAGEFSFGQLSWVSGKYKVSSPISIKFTKAAV